MNGLFNVLKPPGMTSFDVVSYIRRLAGIRKVGHTGTLDPEAVGVLPICVGNATKTIEYMSQNDKSYRAELFLGTVTDTQDSSGKVLEERAVTCSQQEIKEAILSFKGKYNQLPPMYSAIKVEGKKLYELAREGKTIERTPREVEIYDIDIVRFIDDNKVLLDVTCSKGTYIRTLCADIGEKLGCGGHMSFLIRQRSGIFNISEALTLEELENARQNKILESMLTSVEQVFAQYEKVVLNVLEERKFLNGMVFALKGSPKKDGELVTIYNSHEEFLGLGEIVHKQGDALLKSKKLFI